MIALLVAAAVALVLYGLAVSRWWLWVRPDTGPHARGDIALVAGIRWWARPGFAVWLLPDIEIRPRIAWLWMWPAVLWRLTRDAGDILAESLQGPAAEAPPECAPRAP